MATGFTSGPNTKSFWLSLLIENFNFMEINSLNFRNRNELDDILVDWTFWRVCHLNFILNFNLRTQASRIFNHLSSCCHQDDSILSQIRWNRRSKSLLSFIFSWESNQKYQTMSPWFQQSKLSQLRKIVAWKFFCYTRIKEEKTCYVWTNFCSPKTRCEKIVERKFSDV